MQSPDYVATVHRWTDWQSFNCGNGEGLGLAGTAFQTPNFLASFYHARPDGCEDVVVCVRERKENRIVLVLPLILRRERGLRRIEASDLGLSDYVAPLVAEEFRLDPQNIWAAVMQVLPDADVVSFKKMPAEIRPGLANPLAMLDHVEDMGITTKRFELIDADGGTPYRRTGYYKEGQRHLRRLHAACSDIRFQVAATEDEAQRQFDALLDQRAARSAELRRDDPLLRADVQDFYRGLFSQGVESGEILFGALYAAGECIATDLGLIDDGVHYGVLTSMTSGPMRRFSPGTIAHVLMLDESVRRDIGQYDLGVGEFTYKNRLKGRERPLYERHQALSLRGRAGVAEAALRRRVRLGIRAFPELRRPVQALRSRVGMIWRRVAAPIVIALDNPVIQGATYTTLGAI